MYILFMIKVIGVQVYLSKLEVFGVFGVSTKLSYCSLGFVRFRVVSTVE